MTNTLNAALQNLGQLMANNLQTQGVNDAYASNGLTTLANKILDISVGGESEYTYFSPCETYSLITQEDGSLFWEWNNNVNFGDEVGVKAALFSSKSIYMDNGAIYVSSQLSGATIKITDGQSEFTAQITNNADKPFFTYIPQNMGEHNLQILFEGADNYQSCSALRTITVNPGFKIKTDKTIANITDEETVNITIYYGHENYNNQNINLNFAVDGIIINTETVTTNANGIATYSFTPDDDVNYDISASVTVEVDGNEILYESNEVTVIGIEENVTIFEYDTQDSTECYFYFDNDDNIFVDWGDGSSLEEFSAYQACTHNYGNSFSGYIKIYGLKKIVSTLHNNNIIGLTIGDGIPIEGIPELQSISEEIHDLTIGKGITKIPENSFSSYHSPNLEQLTLTNVKKIETISFYSCSNLQSVTLSDNLQYIGRQAFDDCNLNTITIPSSVTYMGNNCLRNNSNLNSVTFEGSVPPVFDGDIFGYYTHSITIYVPSGSLNDYINANNAPDPNNYTYIEY